MQAFFNVVMVMLAVTVAAICVMVVVYAGAIIAIVGSALLIGFLIYYCAKEYILYKREED
jgi:hypothetical protein